MKPKQKHKLGAGTGLIDRAIQRAWQMPPLAHNNNGGSDGKFTVMESAVAAWISEQPEFRQMNFNWLVKHDAIVYDKATGTWKGAGKE